MEEVDENQNFTNRKSEITKDLNSILSQHEALRRATLIKHRKVSTQLKLDMVQRQLSTLRRSGGDADLDRTFYRLQVAELSSELRDLGSTLEEAEKSAFKANRRLLRGVVSSCHVPLSSSNPSLWTSAEDLRRGSLKARVRHLVSSSPAERFRRKHLFGGLRTASSLSSLNVKSGSSASDDSSDPPSSSSSKETTKPWKAPLRFLGQLVDSRFRRRFWGNGSQRTKSADNILDDNSDYKDKNSKGLQGQREDANYKDYKDNEDYKDNKDNDGEEDVFSSSSSSSESENDDEEWRSVKTVPRYAVKGPVVRKISSHQKAQVDPAVLAEIEDFERMAAKYIKQHSREIPPVAY